MQRHPFDFLESNIMKVVTSTFGYEASWTPSAGGDAITGKVLLKTPSREQNIQGADYMAPFGIVEYEKGVLPGLEEAAKHTTNQEKITVNGRQFFVRLPFEKYDGDTIILHLDPITS